MTLPVDYMLKVLPIVHEVRGTRLDFERGLSVHLVLVAPDNLLGLFLEGSMFLQYNGHQ